MVMSEENIKVDEEVEVETTEKTNDESQENTSFTRSEVDSQISKAVDSALKRREAKMQEELEKRIEKERNEAAEYAKLTEKERQEADLNKRLEDLEKREKELNKLQLRSQVEQDLKEHNLPTGLAETLVHTNDNEKIKESIADIKQWLDDAVNEQVKSKLRQDTPSASTKEVSNDPFSAILSKYK